jgi:hypothetical protein
VRSLKVSFVAANFCLRSSVSHLLCLGLCSFYRVCICPSTGLQRRVSSGPAAHGRNIVCRLCVSSLAV